MLHKITRHKTMRWLAPLVALLLVVMGGMLLSNPEDNAKSNTTPTPMPSVTVYTTNAVGGENEFGTELAQPLNIISCAQWQNAVETKMVVSPYRVYNHGKLENPQEFKVIIVTSVSEDGNWLFRWQEAQNNCPNDLFPIAIYVVDKEGDNLVLDYENPVSYLACKEIDPQTLITRGIIDENLVDTAGTSLGAADFRLIKGWHSRLDVAVYKPDIEAVCGITLDS